MCTHCRMKEWVDKCLQAKDQATQEMVGLFRNGGAAWGGGGDVWLLYVD